MRRYQQIIVTSQRRELFWRKIGPKSFSVLPPPQRRNCCRCRETAPAPHARCSFGAPPCGCRTPALRALSLYREMSRTATIGTFSRTGAPPYFNSARFTHRRRSPDRCPAAPVERSVLILGWLQSSFHLPFALPPSAAEQKHPSHQINFLCVTTTISYLLPEAPMTPEGVSIRQFGGLQCASSTTSLHGFHVPGFLVLKYLAARRYIISAACERQLHADALWKYPAHSRITNMYRIISS